MDGKKKPRKIRGFFQVISRRLGALYVSGLQPFRSLDDIKGNAIAFGKGFETITCYRREMAEYIIAILLLKKTKPLTVIEPFYCTICHLRSFSNSM